MSRPGFKLPARILHWTMAPLVLAMLFVGVGMVASLEWRPTLIAFHRPLGVAILLLALIRLGYRWRNPPPPLPADLPRLQVAAAVASHWLLYGLLFAMPLVGWSMLSAGGYPVELWSGMQLPSIVPHNAEFYAPLRAAHSWLSRLLFATILLHVAAALYHAWVRRDGVFAAMARGPSKD
ncbi:MAG: cytochrome b [Lysobacter sp.]